MIAGLAPGEWRAIGTLFDSTLLNKGDEITVSFFDEKGALPELACHYEIFSDESGAEKIWPKLVAEYINKHYILIKAGCFFEACDITPGYGENTLYALKSSGLILAEVDIYRKQKEITDQHKHEIKRPAYDYVFPKNRTDYRAGDRVLHPDSGKIYQCKPWPYTEYCRLGDHMNKQYEPGIGENWSLAWCETN